MTPHKPHHTPIVVAATIAACTATLAVTGCSPTPPTSSWTPTTKTLPPVSSPATYAESPTDPVLYQQAMDVYNKYFQLDAQLQAQGGADQLPPELIALLTGNALTEETQIYQQVKALGLHWDGTPQFQTDKVVQLIYDLPPDTDTALAACETTSGATMLDGDGNPLTDGSPSMAVHWYYMRYDDQQNLLIFDIINGENDVETCPF